MFPTLVPLSIAVQLDTFLNNSLAQLSCLSSLDSNDCLIVFTIILPEVLAGKFHRYKKDTIICTTWLSKAATACGYQTLRILHQAKPEPKKQKTRHQSAD